MATPDLIPVANETMTLSELVAGLQECQVIGAETTQVHGVQFDSRLVGPGSLFVALRGGYVDGHDFLSNAIGNGASAIVVDHEVVASVPQVVVPDSRIALATLAARFYKNPSDGLRVIGVTGTDGKTTTSYILDHILRSVGRVTGMIGTVSLRIGDITVDHESRQTTPESADIQRLLRAMANGGVSDVILEATSHGLDLHRLDHTHFNVGTVTNITQEHLEHHKTRAAYRRAKAILFERVSNAGGVAVVNLDDEGARSVLPYCDECRTVISYSSIDPAATIFADMVTSDLSGTRGAVRYDNVTHPLAIPLVGAFNVSNTLAAIGSAIASGVTYDDAVVAVATTPSIPGRMSSVDAGQPFGLIIDYAHTPESLEKVLKLLRSLRPEGKLIVVFGSAGERDTIKRPIQGRVAAKLADISIITNEDPRFEDPESIIREISDGAVAAGGIKGETFHCVTDRRQAIGLALDLATARDTILLAGKGHERSILWNGIKHPWDEAAIARDELARRGWA